MKELKFGWIIVIFGICCQKIDNQEIIVPELTSDFYSEALFDINKKLISDADNDKLVRQKLFYCERLDWPITCLSALEYEKRRVGMTSQLAENYIRYFINHKQFDLLGDFIDRWNAQYDLYEKNQKSFIQGLIYSEQFPRAQLHLRNFLSKSLDTASLAFASRQYLAIGDTILGVYYLSKLQSSAGDHSLMYLYGDILFDLGQYERAYEVVETYRKHHQLGFEKTIAIAKHYSSSGYLNSAINILRPYSYQDTVSFFISELYLKSYKFDSSIIYLDSILIKDPLNVKAIWKKGRAYEDRGWFSYAINLFEDIIEIDTGYEKAKKRINLIQRKIAYLQRQKQEANRPPVLELKPIKLDN